MEPTDRDVLEANAAFYEAFTQRDFQAMDSIWASSVTVTCIHPGWNRLIGRDAVLRSWKAILSNPGSPQIQCFGATVHAVGPVAWVLCFERARGTPAALIATNVFVLENDTWRIAHHQAGPLAESAGADEDVLDADEDSEDEPPGGGLLN